MSTISVNNITPYTGNSVNINGMVVNNSELTLNTLTSNTLSATTVSATTFYGDGSHLTGISGGTGGGLITRTKAEMDVLIAANGLIAGNFYMITGVDELLYGGTDIVLQAITTNKLSVKGSGIFYNPKYNQEIVGYGVWSNLMSVDFINANNFFGENELVSTDSGALGYYVTDGVIHYLSGDWENSTFICGTTTSATANIASGATSPTHNIGDNVIWGGKHWVKISGDSISVVGQVVATGDTNTGYSFYLLNEYGEIIPHSIIITDGVETFTDNGYGLLAGSMGGSGNINYFGDNGHVNITFDSGVSGGTLITASYDFRQLPVDDFTLPSSWEVIPFNEVDYTVVVDEISYDYDHNVIIGRTDEVGNSVLSSYATISSEAFFMGSGYNSIKVFQWGNISKNYNIRGRFNFTDEGQGNLIGDGGYDMYDGGNQMSTNLNSDIVYTETKFNFSGPALDSQYAKDGYVISGDTWFGVGSEYFTNLYPGLFVMGANGLYVTMDTFAITGNVGADGDGYVTSDSYTLTAYSETYTVYVKKIQGAYDPTVNHIIIVNTDGTGITHDFSNDTNDDFDELTGLSGVTKMYYLLTSTHGSNLPVTKEEIDGMVIAFLDLVDGRPSLADVLTVLNDNYTIITDVLPPRATEEIIGVMGNNIVNSTLNCLNFTGGFIAFNTLINGCEITNNIFSPSINSAMAWNKLENFSNMFGNVIADNGAIYGNTLNYGGINDNTLGRRNINNMGNNSYIDSNQITFSDISRNTLLNSYMYENVLLNQTSINNNELTFSKCELNNLSEGSRIEGNTGLDNFQLNGNILSQNSIITNNTSIQGDITNNVLLIASSIDTNVVNLGSIIKNKLSNSKITENLMNVLVIGNETQISDNELSFSSSISNNTLNNDGYILLNTFETNSHVNDNVIADGSTISWNKVSQSSTIRLSNITGGSIIFNNMDFQSLITDLHGDNVHVDVNTFRGSSLELSVTTMPSGNIIQKNDFSNVSIANDLSSATFIYADYSKNIVKNQSGDTKVTYINSANTLGVEDVTS